MARLVQNRKQSNHNGKIVQRLEERVTELEQKFAERGLQEKARKQIRWVDLARAINTMFSLIIQVPALIALIYEIIKLIFH